MDNKYIFIKNTNENIWFSPFGTAIRKNALIFQFKQRILQLSTYRLFKRVFTTKSGTIITKETKVVIVVPDEITYYENCVDVFTNEILKPFGIMMCTVEKFSVTLDTPTSVAN